MYIISIYRLIFFFFFLKKRYFRINYISIHAYDRCPCARGTYQLVSKIDKKNGISFDEWSSLLITNTI